VSSTRDAEPSVRGRVSLDESSRPHVEGRGRVSLDESRPRGRPSLDETRSRVNMSASPKPTPVPLKGILSTNRALPPLPLKAATQPKRISLTSILGNYQNGSDSSRSSSNRDSTSTTRSISIIIDEPAVLQPVLRGRKASASVSEPRQSKVSGRGFGEGGVAVDGLGMEEWRPIPNHPEGGVWEKHTSSSHGSLLEGQMARRRAEDTQAKALSEERLKTQRLHNEQATRQRALLAALERPDKQDQRLNNHTHQRISSSAYI
jgi:hypothetical protein